MKIINKYILDIYIKFNELNICILNSMNYIYIYKPGGACGIMVIILGKWTQ